MPLAFVAATEGLQFSLNDWRQWQKWDSSAVTRARTHTHTHKS